MHVAQFLVSFFLVMFGAGCADDMPLTANYVPADCPPTSAQVDAAPVDAAAVDEEDPPEESMAEEPPPADATGLVDLNLASERQLTTLPGVGPALAARIIAYREKRPFERPEDLQRVKGIGPAKYAKLKDAITVGELRQKLQP